MIDVGIRGSGPSPGAPSGSQVCCRSRHGDRGGKARIGTPRASARGATAPGRSRGMRGAWGEGPAASRRAQIEPKAALQVPAQRLACKPRLAGTQEQHVHGNDRKLADERQRFERHADAFPESPRPRAKVAHREETAASRAAADLQGRQLRIVDGKTVEGGQRQPSLARIRSDRQQLLAHQPQELHAREAMSRVSRWRRPVLDQQVLRCRRAVRPGSESSAATGPRSCRGPARGRARPGGAAPARRPLDRLRGRFSGGHFDAGDFASFAEGEVCGRQYFDAPHTERGVENLRTRQRDLPMRRARKPGFAAVSGTRPTPTVSTWPMVCRDGKRFRVACGPTLRWPRTFGMEATFAL